MTSPRFRQLVSPLNPAGDPTLATIVRIASTDAFHLAMLVGAALLLAGAIVNAVGIRNPQPAAAAQKRTQPGTVRPAAEEPA